MPDMGALNRRAFLVAAGAGVGVAVLGGGSAEAVAVVPSVPPVVTWELVGGFVGPGFASLRAPRLVAYPDGLAIADAGRQLRLDRAGLSELRRHLATVLADPASTRRRPDVPVIADAPAARFMVRAANRRVYTAEVDGLDESREQHAYPQRLYRLSDHLSRVHHRVTTHGSPFDPAAVRLVAVVDTTSPSPTAVPWPRGIPVPAIARDAFVGQIDLRGAAARTVKRSIPHRTMWPEYRIGDGRLLRVAWRLLLPHE